MEYDQKFKEVLDLLYAVEDHKDVRFLTEEKKTVRVMSDKLDQLFFDVEFLQGVQIRRKTRLRIDTTSTRIVLDRPIGSCISKYPWESKLKPKEATTLEAIVEEILRVAQWVEDGGDIKLRQELLGRQKKELHVGRRLRRRKDHKRRKLVSTF
jgi:hypothetical protein